MKNEILPEETSVWARRIAYTRRNNFAVREMKTFSLQILHLLVCFFLSSQREFLPLKSKHLKPFFFRVNFANNDDVAVFKLYF